MAGDIEAYLNAKRAYSHVRDDMVKLGNLLQAVSTALRDEPERLIFANTGGGLPPEVALSRSAVSVNGNDWKSAQQIMDLLAEYHRVRANLRNAWLTLPPNTRSEMQPLPEGVLPSEGPTRRW